MNIQFSRYLDPAIQGRRKCENRLRGEEMVCRSCKEWTSRLEPCCDGGDEISEAFHDCGCPRCIEECAQGGCDSCHSQLEVMEMPA